MLHVTNGDSTVTKLRRTGLTGPLVAWRDILHDGPVPAGLSLEATSEVRSRFLASIGAGSLPELLHTFGARDAALRAAREVVLWFEHDLYDQLQLIQILDALATQRETSAELICIDRFPGVEPFHGLGQLAPAQLASLWAARQPVSAAQLRVGVRAWKAFCSPDPLALRHLLGTDLGELPFLRAALERFLEEFPSPTDGLARTDRQILRAVAAGNSTFNAIFRANQDQESAPFLGDSSVERRITALTQAHVPLLTRAPIALTPAGERVLAGEVDALQLNPIDLWLGGVHLKGMRGTGVPPV
jgi:hypothetical protein